MNAFGSALVLLFAACLLGCGGAQNETANNGVGESGSSLPMRDGLPVLDTSIAQAPPEVRDAWDKCEAALAIRPPEPEAPMSPEAGARFLEEELAPWTERRVGEVREALRALARLRSGNTKQKLFGAINQAWQYEAMFQAVRLLPTVFADEELEREFRRSFIQALSSWRDEAAASYAQCSDLAPLAPVVMGIWTERCRERLEALPTIEASASTGTSARPQLPVPEPCVHRNRSGQALVPPSVPLGPPPDESFGPEIAVILGDTLTNDPDLADDESVTALRRAIETRLEELGHPLVEEELRARAVTAVLASKLDESSPVCRRAPNLATALAREVPHLVIAEAQLGERDGHPSLDLRFYDPAAPSSDVIPRLSASVAGADGGRDLALSAAALRPPQPGVYGRRRSPREGRVQFRVVRNAPFVRAPEAFQDEVFVTALAACRDELQGQGYVTFGAELHITPSGSLQASRLAVASDSAPRHESVRESFLACVRPALEQLRFACPYDGSAAVIEVNVCVQ